MNDRILNPGVSIAAESATGVDRNSSERRAEGNAIHLTMFNFKNDLSISERDRILRVVRDLGQMTLVKHLVIGPTIQTEREEHTLFGWISIVGFENIEDHDVYMVSETRMAMGAQFMPNQGGWIAADMHHPRLDRLWATTDNRFRHCVAFHFKKDVAAKVQLRMIDSLRDLQSLPGVIAFTVSRNLQVQSSDSPMPWILIADFTGAAEFQAFKRDPRCRALMETAFDSYVEDFFTGDLEITAEITGR